MKITDHQPNEPNGMTSTGGLQIEFLYDPDCPTHDEAMARLNEMLTECGIPAEITTVEVTTPEQATELRFLGSPTIRVNGADIDVGSEARNDYSLTCRAYIRADGRISPLPPKELIRDALSRATDAVG